MRARDANDDREATMTDPREPLFDDDPEPTAEELAAARALAEELDGARAPAPGSLGEVALRVRATVSEQAPLPVRVVSSGVDEGLARRRRVRRRVAFSALAAAAVAVAGFLGTFAVEGPAVPPAAPSLEAPALREVRFAPLPEGERASERVDRLARAASADWLGAALAGEAR
jgi:hypothetical protein